MCGRFTLASKLEMYKQLQRLNRGPVIHPRFNIAPSQPVTAVREVPQSKEREWVNLRWGLIPSWSKDAKTGSKLINCRAETVFEKPSFRSAVKSRRCLIPADGYYEWKAEGKTRQPYHIRMKDGQPFWMAGLWECWRMEDMEIESCTILTINANEYIQTIHQRMPLILQLPQCGVWLDQSVSDQEILSGLFAPYPPDEMTLQAVSSLVNKAGFDAPECIAPAVMEETLF